MKGSKGVNSFASPCRKFGGKLCSTDLLSCHCCWGRLELKAYLNLFVLEDGANAVVKRGSRKHGGHGVGQVQDLLKVRRHSLNKTVTRDTK